MENGGGMLDTGLKGLITDATEVGNICYIVFWHDRSHSNPYNIKLKVELNESVN